MEYFYSHIAENDLNRDFIVALRNYAILIISKRMEQRLTVSCSRIAVSVFREIIPVRI